MVIETSSGFLRSVLPPSSVDCGRNDKGEFYKQKVTSSQDDSGREGRLK